MRKWQSLLISLFFISCSESRTDKLTFIREFESKYYKDIEAVSKALESMNVEQDFELELNKSRDILFHMIDSAGRRANYFYPERRYLHLLENKKEFFVDTWLSSIKIRKGEAAIFNFGIFKRQCRVYYFYRSITDFTTKEILSDYKSNFFSEENDSWVVNAEQENLFFVSESLDDFPFAPVK